MRELVKVVDVTRKRSGAPVYTVLVIDATTGQNGLQQAREFDRALDLDALIVTKLDGTAKGGIALAISHELSLPIVKIGVGEGIDDLRDFDAHDFVRALIGDFDESDLEDEPEVAGDSAAAEAIDHVGAAQADEASIESPVAAIGTAVEVEAGTADAVGAVEVGAAVEQEPAVSDAVSVEPFAATDEADTADVIESPAAADAAEADSAEDAEGAADASGESKMSWADFVAYDDKLKSEGAAKKKHFWERW